MKNKMAIQFMAGLFIVFMASIVQVQAGVIQGTSFGSFSNPEGDFQNENYYQKIENGEDYSSFETGKGLMEKYITGYDPFGKPVYDWKQIPPSSVVIEGTDFDVELDTEFSFGKITYFNGTNKSGSAALKVDLNMELNFSCDGLIQSAQEFTYTLKLKHTYDNNQHDTIEAADYLYMPTRQPLAYFTHNNTKYTLEFTRFGQATEDGGIIDIDQFHVREKHSASANLYGRITKVTMSSTPEPGTFVLAAAGLLGLAGFMRKRNDNI